MDFMNRMNIKYTFFGNINSNTFETAIDPTDCAIPYEVYKVTRNTELAILSTLLISNTDIKNIYMILLHIKRSVLAHQV